MLRFASALDKGQETFKGNVEGGIGAGAPLLYGLLQLTPGFVHPTGATTYASLQARGGMDPKTVRRALPQLVDTGWIIADQWMLLGRSSSKKPLETCREVTGANACLSMVKLG